MSEATSRPESILRLALLGAACLATVIAASLLTTYLVTLIHPIGDIPLIPSFVSVVTLDAGFIAIALLRAHTVGHGSWRQGAGFLPIQRPRLLAGLAAAILTTPFIWAGLLSPLLKSVDVPDILRTITQIRQAPLAYAATTFMVAIVAPIAEELFFRGWLWTGLRRHWSPLPTAIATALPWVLLHAVGSPLRPLFLIPAAIILSVARHKCGSIRATIFLHMLNNSFAALLATLIGLYVN